MARRVCLIMVLAAACGGGEASERAAADRSVLNAADAASFASALRARYESERACVEQRFPSTVYLDTSATARGLNERMMRPYELLRGLDLVRREEVSPGDPDWGLPARAHVDSGGSKRIVRYTLAVAALRDAEDAHDATPGLRRLCGARWRLVSLDSVVKRTPSPAWSLQDGVRYSDATAYALHTIVADSVAAWVPAVVQRDTLQDFGMLHPRFLAGRQQRWGEFRVHDGALQLLDVRVSGPP